MKKQVVIDFTGHSSNAHGLIASFRKAASRQGFDSSWINEVTAEATTGDFDHCLGTLLEHSTPEAEVITKEDIPEVDSDIDEKEGASYWNNKGKQQELKDIFYKKLIPPSGKASTPHGELLRQYCNFYYDVYNNGLGNDYFREAQFLVDNMDKLSPFISPEDLAVILPKLEKYIAIPECDICRGDICYTEEEECTACDDGEDDNGEVCEECCGSGTQGIELECKNCSGYADMFIDSKSLDSLGDAIVLYINSIENL